MRNLALLSTCVFTALLTACGGSQPPVAASDATPALSHDRTFKYTGSKQSFKVPTGVTHITITAYGANGALGNDQFSGYAASGGNGGMVTATIPVTPGERLAIFVGGSGGHGGFNGGGGVAGQRCPKGCYGLGGGASDVRQGGDRITDRVIVAAGGGGGASNGYSCYESSCGSGGGGGAGGSGGGRKGEPGNNGSGMLNGAGGTGGTQKTGGKAGAGGGGSNCGGSDGTLGTGGVGGPENGCGANGGGGGGGYYGGGGGGGGDYESTDDYGPGGGGGGGSSFAESRARHVKIMSGGLRSDGSIVFLW
jgi:hypothetical protein